MLSTGEWIRNKRLNGARPQPGYFRNQGVPSGSPADNTTAKAMVLACIDPRYTYAVEKFLIDQLDAQHYFDLFALAGASLGAGAHGSTVGDLYDPALYQEVFFEHLQIAVALHSITDVYVFDHLDCGAYKNFFGSPLAANLPDCSTVQHVTGIEQMKSALASSGISSIENLTVTSYIIDSPECPSGTGCFSEVVGTTVSPTSYCVDIPPNTGASVLVLGCIDPRYSALLSRFLLEYKDIQFNYDLFNLAGASLGFNQSYTTYDTVRTAVATAPYSSNLIPQWGVNWGPVFCQHVRIALAIHNITEIWTFDHLDCGAYKRIKFGDANATDDDIGQHTPELQKMMTSILSEFPSLSFKGFVMDTAGEITQVVGSGGGLVIPNTKPFGSSRIRKYASLNTDRIGFNSGDQLIKLDVGCGTPRIIATRLCSCIPSLASKRGLCPTCRKP